MNLRIFFGAVCLCASMGVEAQSVANAYKGVSNGNPISACVFCADPTALEFDGRVYVYGSNDSQQFLVNNKKGSNKYKTIKSLVIFSTNNIIN